MDLSQAIIEGDKVLVYNSNSTIETYPLIHKPITVSSVKCNHCGSIYDLRKVTVGHRYMDCDSYSTPCCKVMADTRAYKSFNDFERITINPIKEGERL